MSSETPNETRDDLDFLFGPVIEEQADVTKEITKLENMPSDAEILRKELDDALRREQTLREALEPFAWVGECVNESEDEKEITIRVESKLEERKVADDGTPFIETQRVLMGKAFRHAHKVLKDDELTNTARLEASARLEFFHKLVKSVRNLMNDVHNEGKYYFLKCNDCGLCGVSSNWDECWNYEHTDCDLCCNQCMSTDCDEASFEDLILYTFDEIYKNAESTLRGHVLLDGLWKQAAGEALNVRGVVAAFAVRMEEVLRSHDDKKSGWQSDSIESLEQRLMQEWGEYRGATGHKQAAHDITDVANFCMMLWDRHCMEHAKEVFIKAPEGKSNAL